MECSRLQGELNNAYIILSGFDLCSESGVCVKTRVPGGCSVCFLFVSTFQRVFSRKREDRKLSLGIDIRANKNCEHKEVSELGELGV